MKKHYNLGLTIALFAFMAMFSGTAAAQVMVGGFKAVSVKDKGVIAAAQFATKKIGQNEEMDLTLESILKAEQQVVAGMNYKLFFKTTYADGGELYDLCLTAKVYRNLKNVYTLSSWDSQECPE